MLKIDTHAHFFPPQWVELMRSEGVKHGVQFGTNAKGYPTMVTPGVLLKSTLAPTYVEVERRLKVMDEARVDMHALSLTSPMVYWAPAEFGVKLAQTFNDACAEVHLKYPQRFVGMATLPMQDVPSAVAELERAAKLPGIRGVYMATHINGRNLDDKAFWPVYAKCEELGMPIFLHPTAVLAAERMSKYHLGNFLGNPYETGVAAASLMFGGALDDFPKLDVMLPHAGGTFPHLIGRMDHGYTVRPEIKDLPRKPSEYLRRFHYDTISHDDRMLVYLIRQVGVDRVVMGSDCPADMSYTRPVDVIERLADLSRDEKESILSSNAARLLRL